ncbi:GNAT family N-acetyltransferase [Roseobacteraceae bacterium NS-SX3]
MIIRPAREGDAAAISEIANWVIRDTLFTFTTEAKTEDALAGEIAAKGACYLVAEVEGRLAGHATCGPFRAGPGYAHTAELTIHLAPWAQGQGIGRALMAALEKAAQEAGIHVLVAGISGANPGAIAFHRRLGFAECGRVAEAGRKAGQWLDLVLMQKILPPRGTGAPDSAPKPD